MSKNKKIKNYEWIKAGNADLLFIQSSSGKPTCSEHSCNSVHFSTSLYIHFWFQLLNSIMLFYLTVNGR